MVKPTQRDVYCVRFGPVHDSGPAGKRPAIVIQNDLLNRSKLNTTVVTLLTSKERLAKVPGNVLLKKGAANLPKTSVVVVSQMATIDNQRLLEKIGTLDRKSIEEIIRGCQMVISPALF